MLPMPQPFPVRLFTPSVQYVSTHRVIHTIHRLLWISQSYPQTVDNLLLTFVLQAGIAGAVYTLPIHTPPDAPSAPCSPSHWTVSQY